MGNQSSRSKDASLQKNGSSVLKEGWLEFNESSTLSGWKRYWIVIDNGVLSCYKGDPSKSLNTAVIQLNLREYKCCSDSKIQKSKGDYFYIDLKHIYYSKQIFRFRTNSKSDYKQWIAKLGEFESEHGKDDEDHTYTSTEQSDPRPHLAMMMQYLDTGDVDVDDRNNINHGIIITGNINGDDNTDENLRLTVTHNPLR